MNKNCDITLGIMLTLTTAFTADWAAAADETTQTCVIPPTCESLGYDKNEADCVDKAILKCPFDDSKIFCSNGIADGVTPTPGFGGGSGPNGSYLIGDLLTCNGKAVGYVIEVNSSGAAGRISSMDYENGGAATYSSATGHSYCTAKTTCGLSWELARSQDELKNICMAKGKIALDSLIYQGGSDNYSYRYDSKCSMSSDFSTSYKDRHKIFCTAAFVSDKTNGGAEEKPSVTYKVGDTYVKDGVALGQVVSVDSSGQHGVLAVSGGTATASQASTNCSAKINGGLNWALATGENTCKIVGNTVSGCMIHSSTSDGYCSYGFHSHSSCLDQEKAYACEAPF